MELGQYHSEWFKKEKRKKKPTSKLQLEFQGSTFLVKMERLDRLVSSTLNYFRGFLLLFYFFLKILRSAHSGCKSVQSWVHTPALAGSLIVVVV